MFSRTWSPLRRMFRSTSHRLRPPLGSLRELSRPGASRPRKTFTARAGWRLNAGGPASLRPNQLPSRRGSESSGRVEIEQRGGVTCIDRNRKRARWREREIAQAMLELQEPQRHDV
jgi:hypothetical protein